MTQYNMHGGRSDHTWSNYDAYVKAWTQFCIKLDLYHGRFGLIMPQEIRDALWERLVDKDRDSD